MEITRVEVTYGVTVSYAKYRFIRLEYTTGVKLNDDDNAVSVIEALREKLRNKVAEDAKREIKAWRKLGAQVEANDGPPQIEFNFD